MVHIRSGLALASALFLAACGSAVTAIPGALLSAAGLAAKPAQESGDESASSGAAGKEHALTRNIQAGLITLGYDPGPADGRLDAKTRAAIRRYQSDNTLPVNGEPSAYLWDDIKDRI